MKVRNLVVIFLLSFIFCPNLATAGICESRYNACIKDCEYRYNSDYYGGGRNPKAYEGCIFNCKATYNSCKAKEKTKDAYEHFC